MLFLVMGIVILLAACNSNTPATPPTESDSSQDVAAPTLTVTQVSTVANTPLPSPTTFVMPTPGPTPTSVCEGAPRNRLILHERARVLALDPRPLNMRTLPGIENRVIERIDAGDVFYVIDGPECEDGFAWYFVEYNDVAGWIAEGDNTSYFVEPYLPG